MIKAGIIGATGYAGATLVYLLNNHAEVEIVYLASHSYAGQSFSSLYPGMQNSVDIILEETDINKASNICDVVFLALPAGHASSLVTQSVLDNTVIIDLGADFRLDNAEVYNKWYKTEAAPANILEQAVYSLADINPFKAKSSNLIANPGCYTTCSILTLAPLVINSLIDSTSIVINAMSGVSGAGRKANVANMFCEVNGSIKAYGVGTHRHTPEIEMALSKLSNKEVIVQFTPHLVPMNRGILSNCTAKLKKGVTKELVYKAYRDLYENSPFVNLLDYGTFPETRFTLGTNRIDIGYIVDSRTNNIVSIGAIDNLVKGAAGQAVQNMNLKFNLDSTLGLAKCCANPY